MLVFSVLWRLCATNMFFMAFDSILLIITTLKIRYDVILYLLIT